MEPTMEKLFKYRFEDEIFKRTGDFGNLLYCFSRWYNFKFEKL